MDKQLARKAAHWWADWLRQGNAPLDNGDRSITGAITFAAAKIAQASETVTQSDADKFEDALAQILEADNSKYFYCGCDYGPDGWLRDAADKAGIHLGGLSLPWKTMMNIHEGKIQVAVGYGTPFQELP